MAPLPLDDIRVVEAGASRAVAYCGRLLADLGAEVIKLEPPTGDPMRHTGPFAGGVPDPECSAAFAYFHGGKKSIVLDPADAGWEGRLAPLLRDTDVLLDDRGLADVQWTADGERLAREFPRLVHITISPYGLDGPYAEYRGNALTAWAMSGIMASTGDPDREPLANSADPADLFAGQQALLAALAALEAREQTGIGDRAEVSMAESMAAADDYTAYIYAAGGVVRKRYYSQHMWGFPATIAPCKDGWVTVIAGGGHANALALLVGEPELEMHPLFQSPRARQIDQFGFLDLLAPYLMSHTTDEILDTAQVLGLPFGPVLDMRGVAENPQLIARGFFREVATGRCRVAVPGPTVVPVAAGQQAVAPLPPALGADQPLAEAEATR